MMMMIMMSMMMMMITKVLQYNDLCCSPARSLFRFVQTIVGGGLPVGFDGYDDHDDYDEHKEYDD